MIDYKPLISLIENIKQHLMLCNNPNHKDYIESKGLIRSSLIIYANPYQYRFVCIKCRHEFKMSGFFDLEREFPDLSEQLSFVGKGTTKIEKWLKFQKVINY